MTKERHGTLSATVTGAAITGGDAGVGAIVGGIIGSVASHVEGNR